VYCVNKIVQIQVKNPLSLALLAHAIVPNSSNDKAKLAHHHPTDKTHHRDKQLVPFHSLVHSPRRSRDSSGQSSVGSLHPSIDRPGGHGSRRGWGSRGRRPANLGSAQAWRHRAER
jgi:hypothetical protein